MSATVGDGIRAIVDTMQEYGHYQGSYGNPHVGFCIVGAHAFNLAGKEWPDWKKWQKSLLTAWDSPEIDVIRRKVGPVPNYSDNTPFSVIAKALNMIADEVESEGTDVETGDAGLAP